MFATCNLSEAVAAVNRLPREDAYGPSPIASSTRNTKQIDLWTEVDCIRGHAFDFTQLLAFRSSPPGKLQGSKSSGPIRTAGYGESRRSAARKVTRARRAFASGPNSTLSPSCKAGRAPRPAHAFTPFLDIGHEVALRSNAGAG